MQSDKISILDHCGIVAIYSRDDIQFFERGLRGLRLLQTRGYDGAGFLALDQMGNIFQHKGIGMVNEVFTSSVQAKYKAVSAKLWIYQVRYGTSGGFHPDNVQPFSAVHRTSGDVFVVAHNGQFSYDKATESKFVSDTYIFTQELAESSESTWDERIASVLSKKSGAWSLIVGTKKALYLARDPYGIRPLVYGHLLQPATKQYSFVAASETSALEAIGVSDIFELLPGTIAKVTDTGLVIIEKRTTRQRALCIFENIYIQHGSGRAHLPRSNARAIHKSPLVDDVRRRSGKILAREAPLSSDLVDIVIGVPGTGIEGGMSYSRAIDVPYFQAITDKANSLTEQRTFMTAEVDSIYQKVLDHFNFNAQLLLGRRVVLVDDSIVRGNIARGLVYLLKTLYKVKEVHFRILSPAIDKGCHLGINTRSETELIAARRFGNVEEIRKELGATSLAYLSSAGLREALTGNSKAPGFCMGCMVGHSPPI